MALNKELNTRLKAIDNIRAEFKKAEESAAKEIMDLLKDLMKSNPLLEGVRWNQYTPHFNDGDVCEFGVNGPEFKFSETIIPLKDENDEDEDEDYNNEGWFDDYTVDDDFFNKRADVLNHKQITAIKKSVKDIFTVFEKLTNMQDQLKNMFGDGYQITVTAKGVEIEGYDHD